MYLPNAQNAIIEASKVEGYLLSRTHARGAAKARFFYSFGFLAEDAELFRRAILGHAGSHQASATHRTLYGQIFEVNGRLSSPDGRNPWIRVVWFIATGEKIPRLVTALPSREETS